MKLRLLLWPDCNRACPGCCNKNWDLDRLQVAENYLGFDEVILTGGEPMLKPSLVIAAAAEVRQECVAGAIYVYTAKVDDVYWAREVLEHVDGFTVSLHQQEDLAAWQRFDAALSSRHYYTKSLRLNVFEGIRMPSQLPLWWHVKTAVKWLDPCPLPAGETFMRWGGPIIC